MNPKGIGGAVDFGASYQITSKLLLSASVNDLGFIKWKEDTYTYRSNEDFKFDGIVTTIQQIDRNQKIDTDIKGYDYETITKGYTTSLRTSVNLSARYQLAKKLYADGVANLSVYRGLRFGASLGAYWEWKRFLNISVGNTLAYGRAFNPSVGLVLKPGPIQFYVVTDNLATVFGPSMASKGVDNAFVSPYNSKAFGFRFGINLVFGRVKEQSSLQSIVK